MTSENEKESKDEWLALIKKNYFDARAQALDGIKSIRSEITELDDEIAHTRSKKKGAVLWNQRRLLATIGLASTTRLISLNQDYMLATQIEKLRDEMRGRPANPTLEETSKQLEGEIRRIADEQLAKRIDQMSSGKKGA